MNIKIKRVYEPSEEGDGTRILVDRLWPRGLTKERANIDLWLKEIAPSTELRKWFGHDPDKWHEFRRRYRKEIMRNKDLFDRIKENAIRRPITLVYAARDEKHNEAAVLKQFLEANNQ